MNCLIVYDELSALDLLKQNIKKIPFLKLEAICKDIAETIDIVNRHSINIIFWDIQLPGKNSLYLLHSLKYLPPIILISAYPEHAVDGFDLDVVDYLLKPVIFPRFLKSVQKAQQFLRITNLANKVSNGETEYVFVNANYSLVKVMLHEITFIEGLKDYIRINSVSGKVIVTRLGLKTIEDKLGPAKFMRVHRSYIIALDKIDSIQKTQLTIRGREIPISDGYRQPLQSYINSKNL